MRIPRIYTPQSLSVGATVQLEDGPARHVGTVLRMSAGRSLVLFNGEGGEYLAEITAASKKNVTVDVKSFADTDKESPLKIHLGIGLSRGERFELVLQKACELGVTEITPLFTERCEVKLSGPRLEKKLNSWRQLLIASCEQCQRNTLPALNLPMDVSAWLTGTHAEQKFVLHHRTEQALASTQKPSSVALVIGPEGGLSEAEIGQAERHNFKPLALGPRVFRTETAPLAAISIIQYLWGDLS